MVGEYDDDHQTTGNSIPISCSDQANEPKYLNNTDRIARIRILLRNKPKNARAMATLACLISSNEKSIYKEDCYDLHKSTSEAIKLAEDSIAIAPTKPYGYTAMSIVHPVFQVRMDALRMAIQQCAARDQFFLASIDLHVRLLTEQRYEKTRIGTPHVGLVSHEVTNNERIIFKQVDVLFHNAWKDPTVTRNIESMEFLSFREYRLGRFFRKLEPSNIYRDISIFYFEKAISHLPRSHTDHTMARFWLATLKPITNGESNPTFTQCPPEYIIGLYSTFAPRFNNLLVGKLEYETPKILRSLHDRAVLEPWNHPVDRRYRAIADLGCGTGLSGLAFASLSFNQGNEIGEMTGVDLSPEMLAFAEKTRCYKRLVAGDISSVLKEPGVWDLVLACDVFCYIGDLSHVFRMVHASLMHDGIFIFSTEKVSDECHGPFYLHDCARFAHSTDYIASLAESNSFEMLTMQVCPIRKNKGKDVSGILTILRKLPT